MEPLYASSYYDRRLRYATVRVRHVMTIWLEVRAEAILQVLVPNTRAMGLWEM